MKTVGGFFSVWVLFSLPSFAGCIIQDESEVPSELPETFDPTGDSDQVSPNGTLFPPFTGTPLPVTPTQTPMRGSLTPSPEYFTPTASSSPRAQTSTVMPEVTESPFEVITSVVSPTMTPTLETNSPASISPEVSLTPQPVSTQVPVLLNVLEPEDQGAGIGAFYQGLVYREDEQRFVFADFDLDVLWSISARIGGKPPEAVALDWNLDDTDLTWNPALRAFFVVLDDDEEGGYDSLMVLPSSSGQMRQAYELKLVRTAEHVDDTEDPKGIAFDPLTERYFIKACAATPPCTDSTCTEDQIGIWEVDEQATAIRLVVTAAQVQSQTGYQIRWMPDIEMQPLSGLIVATTSEQVLIAIDPDTGEARELYDLSVDIGPNLVGVAFAPNGDFAVMASTQMDSSIRRIFVYDATGDERFDTSRTP